MRRSQALTQADERLLCATPLITDLKGVTVPAEPVSEHQIHSFFISLDSGSETAPFCSSQPQPQHLLAAARRDDHQIPQLLVATGRGGM